VWNVLKYSSHCNQTVKVTTPQSDTCTLFCLQFGKQGLDTTGSFGSLYSVLFLFCLRFIEACIDVICNCHNSRYWSKENPRAVCEVLLHSLKTRMWRALSAQRIMFVYCDKTITSKCDIRLIPKPFCDQLMEDIIIHPFWKRQRILIDFSPRETFL
jgi:hypothetical protein